MGEIGNPVRRIVAPEPVTEPVEPEREQPEPAPVPEPVRKDPVPA
jgi:hypothetical protein